MALLTGCVQQVLAPNINRATVEVLTANGVEVIVPPNQGCCGSILSHIGEDQQAKILAARNFDLFGDEVDAVITNAAGCGSGIHEYGLLFKGDELEQQAHQFADRVVDVSVFLADLGLINVPADQPQRRVVYHDACHLAHAQGIIDPPRSLLSGIPNLALIELEDGGLCCGSAGTYNLEQPEIAAELGRRKVEAILNLKPQMVVMGNIGCMTQIETHLSRLGQSLPVMHTVELLAEAYRR